MSEEYPPGAPVAALEHLARLVAKRDAIQRAIDSAGWQLVAEGGRIGDNPEVALVLHDAIKSARASDGLSGASSELAAECGYSISHLRRLQRNGLLLGAHDAPFFAGVFPLGWQRCPSKGVPCVYALFNEADDLVYIGQTKNARSRLSTHWAQKKELGLARWAVAVIPEGSDRLAVELALIQQFKPRGNKAGVK